MVRKCYLCGIIMGEKEPLEDKTTTGGECDICHQLFKDWYTLWKEGKTKELSTEYILRKRKEVDS
jgi:hypothetical protein